MLLQTHIMGCDNKRIGMFGPRAGLVLLFSKVSPSFWRFFFYFVLKNILFVKRTCVVIVNKKSTLVNKGEFKHLSQLTGLILSFSLEEDFVSWREQFWPAVCEHFGVEALGDESRFIPRHFCYHLKFFTFQLPYFCPHHS